MAASGSDSWMLSPAIPMALSMVSTEPYSERSYAVLAASRRVP
jgi:hypothetical protein